MRSPMPDRPEGTVTFLFTDVEGSTRLLAELGEDYAGRLAAHGRVVREAVARHGGVEVDTQGTPSSSRSPRRERHSPPQAKRRRLSSCPCASESTPARPSAPTRGTSAWRCTGPPAYARLRTAARSSCPRPHVRR